AGDLPRAAMTCPAQHERGVAERTLASLETILVRHPTVGQRDLAVLHNLERDLVLHLLDAEPGCRLVLDDETLDLVVGDIACPNDRDVAPWRVADPPLLAIQNPSVAFALCSRRQASTRTRPDERLRQCEAADLFHASHGWQPLLLLLFIAGEID